METLETEIKEKHVLAGQRNNPFFCPLALAIGDSEANKEAFLVKGIRVDKVGTIIEDLSGQYWEYEHPKELFYKILDFDKLGYISPIKVKLKGKVLNVDKEKVNVIKDIEEASMERR